MALGFETEYEYFNLMPSLNFRNIEQAKIVGP